MKADILTLYSFGLVFTVLPELYVVTPKKISEMLHWSQRTIEQKSDHKTGHLKE